MGCINSGNVPLILNAHIEEELYHNLFEIYRPSYVCLPTRMASALRYEIVCECYGYTLLHTGMGPCTLHADLSHLLPTSGSTGSPKLVRHKYGNIEAAALNISTFLLGLRLMTGHCWCCLCIIRWDCQSYSVICMWALLY